MHRRADLVAHVGQKLALGFGGRLGGFLGFSQGVFPLGEIVVGGADARRHQIEASSGFGQFVPTPDRHLIAELAGGNAPRAFGEIAQLAREVHAQRQREQGHQAHLQHRQPNAVTPGGRLKPQGLHDGQPQFDPAEDHARLFDLRGDVENLVVDRPEVGIGHERSRQEGFIAGGRQHPAVRIPHPGVEHARIVQGLLDEALQRGQIAGDDRVLGGHRECLDRGSCPLREFLLHRALDEVQTAPDQQSEHDRLDGGDAQDGLQPK